jgi:hypothetical protein
LSTVPIGNTVVQLHRSASSKAAQAEHSTVQQTRSGPQHFHTRAAKSLAADTFFFANVFLSKCQSGVSNIKIFQVVTKKENEFRKEYNESISSNNSAPKRRRKQITDTALTRS